jgi:hypothetical protein
VIVFHRRFYIYISEVNSSSKPGGYFTLISMYNHAHRHRLEKLLYTELSRSSNGYFKPLLGPCGGSLLIPPHGGLRSETAVTKPFRK